MNIVFLASTIFCLGAILYIGLKLAKKQPVPKNYLKLFISILLGVFSFTIEFPFRDTAVKIAILPLGVWILFMLLRKKEGAWERYRKFAWLGFFSNYLFWLCKCIRWIITQISTLTRKEELICLHYNIY